MWITDLVNCLETSTLAHPRLEESLAIKQQHLPRHIYKYRSDSGNSRNNLTTDTVWLGSPESYNDPYDCLFTLSDDLVVAAFKKRLVDDFLRIYRLQSVISAELIEGAKKSQEPLKTIAGYIQEAKISVKGGNPKQMADFCSTAAALRPIKDAISILRLFRKVTKLCSFSAVNDSLLMWSHYADHHKGFCLEYDLEALDANHDLRRFLYPVVYSGQLYDLTSFAENLFSSDRQQFNPILPLLGVLHKFDGWEYEQEWRLVSITAAVTEDHNWAVPTPSRIFLGSKFNASANTELLAICKQKKIPMSQMRLADDRFELVPEQVADH
jgi:Protein of unknown function (DUF2971)